jgi:TRAP-type C4-dicarboxylate transport system substrate-binding protein
MARAPLACVGCVVAGVLVAAPAVAQDIVWNFNIFGPKRAVTAGIEAMAEFYKKESNGKFEIKRRSDPSGRRPRRSRPGAMKAR